MSDKQGTNDPLDDERLAFEYTSGLLRGEERSEFERQLAAQPALQKLVQFWEEQLMHMQDSAPLEPKPSTWSAIDARVNPAVSSNDPPLKWVWALFGAMVAVFVLLVFPMPNQVNPAAPSVDYVAVMTDNNQQPGLTTFGAERDKKLSLHWQLASLADETKAYQLWAVSKRDGQTRSIAILENNTIQELQLSDANWRLITDAESLILTLEDAGGSTIGEPSEYIVASGVCVRIRPQRLPG
ncbi:MAG: anti-sigma-K factor RskA [Candidatus Azotimanducaceae bacterium]|jgi:anti-sigma-K factor RskA